MKRDERDREKPRSVGLAGKGADDGRAGKGAIGARHAISDKVRTALRDSE